MKKVMILFLAVIVCGCMGCRKPYDEPEYRTVKNNETAFVIPLEGKTSNQGKLKSEDYLRSMQVATKRIRIPHRWNQTGRRVWAGKWIDTVTVLTVNRTPVTREWTADSKSGTSRSNQAIWVESKDSVSFSIGFNCTGYVKESDAAKFLYTYPSTSLASLMDTEVRAMIQSVASLACGEYEMDILRGKKKEVIAAVRDSVIPFFSSRGISITTIGMFGGFTYKNPKIQDSIDKTFVAQQEKVIAAAMFEAQAKKNERIELEAEAIANRERTIAQGEADRITSVAEAASKANSNPVFLKLRQLEVEQERINKWDGAYPKWYMSGSGDSPQILLQQPAQ